MTLGKALAAELAKANVNVNARAPGPVATPLNAPLRGPGHEGDERRMRPRTPTGRSFMDIEDMAGTAVSLASDGAKGVQGAS